MSVFSFSLYMRRSAAAALVFCLAGAGFSPAFAADTRSTAYPPAPAQTAPGASVAPMRAYKGVCSSFLVRHEAKNHFARQMRGVPHNPRLLIKHFTNIQETQASFGPETYDIDRRYCTATVIMNNGQSYQAVYAIARNQGFAAIGGLHISFCVIGLDNWLIRDNDCRSLRAPEQSIY